MKILVLGAKSFTGSWFAKVASAAGHEVAGLNVRNGTFGIREARRCRTRSPPAIGM